MTNNQIDPFLVTSPAPDYPALTNDQLLAIVDRHNLKVEMEKITRLDSIGTVNAVYGIGENLVLRVPAQHGVHETLTESVAAPAAKAAGVKTPELIVFDNSQSIVNAPYTIFERVQGENFGLYELQTQSNHDHVYMEIGRQLARLHLGVSECVDPLDYLDKPARREPAQVVSSLTENWKISAHNEHWLNKLTDRIRPAIEEAKSYRRFLHNDALPTNIIVDRSGRFPALIDWNNSGWGDPALEFSSIPPRAIPTVLKGYREISPIDGDDSAEARILWDHLCLALEFSEQLPRPGNISWARPPLARLTEILAASSTIKTWSLLLS